MDGAFFLSVENLQLWFYSDCHNTVPFGLEAGPIFFQKDISTHALPCARRRDDETRSDGGSIRPEKHHPSGRALR